jgi:hypothetical protein
MRDWEAFSVRKTARTPAFKSVQSPACTSLQTVSGGGVTGWASTAFSACSRDQSAAWSRPSWRVGGCKKGPWQPGQTPPSTLPNNVGSVVSSVRNA